MLIAIKSKLSALVSAPTASHGAPYDASGAVAPAHPAAATPPPIAVAAAAAAAAATGAARAATAVQIERLEAWRDAMVGRITSAVHTASATAAALGADAAHLRFCSGDPASGRGGGGGGTAGLSADVLASAAAEPDCLTTGGVAASSVYAAHVGPGAVAWLGLPAGAHGDAAAAGPTSSQSPLAPRSAAAAVGMAADAAAAMVAAVVAAARRASGDGQAAAGVATEAEAAAAKPGARRGSRSASQASAVGEVASGRGGGGGGGGATHLVIMANGLFGSPDNWSVIREQLQQHLDTGAVVLHASQDDPQRGLYFYSALAAFASRTAYANTDGDHLVGWANSSLRFMHQLPTLPPEAGRARGVVLEDPLLAAFDVRQQPDPAPHSATGPGWGDVPIDMPRRAEGSRDASPTAAATRPRPAPSSAAAPSAAAAAGSGGSSSAAASAAMAEMMLQRLQRLPWRRIDVSFGGALFGFAHNNIQVTRRWLNFEGMAVAGHLARQVAALEAQWQQREGREAGGTPQKQQQLLLEEEGTALTSVAAAGGVSLRQQEAGQGAGTQSSQPTALSPAPAAPPPLAPSAAVGLGGAARSTRPLLTGAEAAEMQSVLDGQQRGGEGRPEERR
ncbi:hypothetical protein TSOC_004283 [Tetrabaena socialis]|uniref:DUF676 domain-containing protein n=1 Tax=Tetrabaena socialis TaxID=47790 RepID=A0A2J8A9B4_9CHLO|nr:hypothetical protein TSOC_004283 [Tetrabaena socialis]|eukprot:PNH09122.1 hypothetical protein TSOC_004283 [Tetrabaena socialis]